MTQDPTRHHYVVDEPQLCSRARGLARPDSDLDLLVTVPDAWLASRSRFVETDALGWKLAHHRLPIELLLYSASEVAQRRHGGVNVIAEAFRYGRRLDPAEPSHGPG
jgi:hypothetical protein